MLRGLFLLINRYQNLIPIIVLIGILLCDDFADIKETDDNLELIQSIGERILSYIIVLIITVILVHVIVVCCIP